MARNWILIRGLARSSAHWGRFREMIQTHFPADHFEFLDAAGNGDRQSEKSFKSISGAVNDLRLNSKFIAEGQKINIIAISMGAMMAVDWVKRYPEEVESVVCINTSSGGTSKFWERLRPESYWPLTKILVSNASPLRREILSLELITNLLKDRLEVASEFSKVPVTTRENFFRQIFAASKYRFPNQTPTKPLLLLCADGDRLVSSQCTKNIGKMWGITPQIHSHAGHDLPLDDPEWLLTQISHFAGSRP